MNKTQSTPAVEISAVIPVYNEEDNLAPLLDELEEVLNGIGRPYEVLCIDDKSTDSSVEVLKKLKETKPYLRILLHRINSGESAAGATGFEHARGDIIVTLDADQQNDPHDIPALLDALKEDVVAVCGVRRKREDDWVKRLSSRIANGFRNGITGDKISDAGCTFRALRTEALREVPVFNGMHRFLPTMLRLEGYRVEEILVNHRPRTRGVSKYGVGNRAWRGIVDCFAMRWFRKRCVNARRFDSEL